ncbi:MAG: hypothetical protein JSU73_09075 [candidate division WOR-3 bacterium]|nr:MAG: hypothetical protein JSU73_09075 [candidate division WOR-3 bacterium]
MLRPSRQRLYASLLALGACVLLSRAAMMLAGGALAVLTAWVSALLVAELVVDLAVLAGAVRWWIANTAKSAGPALRAGAAAAILHALRVLVFVLGRTGPLVDFDVRPEHRALHSTRWTWSGVWFAAVMSALGLLVVLVIWLLRRRTRRRSDRLQDGPA